MGRLPCFEWKAFGDSAPLQLRRRSRKTDRGEGRKMTRPASAALWRLQHLFSQLSRPATLAVVPRSTAAYRYKWPRDGTETQGNICKPGRRNRSAHAWRVAEKSRKWLIPGGIVGEAGCRGQVKASRGTQGLIAKLKRVCVQLEHLAVSLWGVCAC